jgi:hypothetical protein
LVCHVLVVARASHDVVRIAPSRHLHYVITGAEIASGAADHEKLDRCACADPLNRVHELIGELHAECIAGPGAIECQLAHVVVFFVDQMFVCHRVPPLTHRVNPTGRSRSGDGDLHTSRPPPRGGGAVLPI